MEVSKKFQVPHVSIWQFAVSDKVNLCEPQAQLKAIWFPKRKGNGLFRIHRKTCCHYRKLALNFSVKKFILQSTWTLNIWFTLNFGRSSKILWYSFNVQPYSTDHSPSWMNVMELEWNFCLLVDCDFEVLQKQGDRKSRLKLCKARKSLIRLSYNVFS